MKDLGDVELFKLVQNDNQHAFDVLYYRYSTKLLIIAKSKLKSLVIGEEIVHDVFVKLWTVRKVLQIEKSLEGYLVVMLRNEILQLVRKSNNKEIWIEEIVSNEKAFSVPHEDPLIAEELWTKLAKIIDDLPSQRKLIYKLSHDENLTISAISENLSLSRQTIKNQLTSAVKEIRLKITEVITVTILIINELL